MIKIPTNNFEDGGFAAGISSAKVAVGDDASSVENMIEGVTNIGGTVDVRVSAGRSVGVGGAGWVAAFFTNKFCP